MGYYSIYKIIKDIIRTLFNSKIMKYLLILIMIIIILFIFNNNFSLSTNATYTYTYNNNTKTFTIDEDLLNYNYIFSCVCTNPSYSPNGQVHFIASDTQPTFYSTTGTYGALYINFPTGAVVKTWGYQGNIANYIKNGVNLTSDMVSTLTSTSGQPVYISIPYWNSSYNYGYSDMNTISYLSTFDITINDTTYFNTNYSIYQSPSLSNSQSDLENLSFNNFIINANSYSEDITNNDGTLFMLFYNRSLSNSNNTEGLYPIKEKGFTKGSIYTDSSSTDDNLIFNFPIFQSGVFFNIGSTYEIKFAYKTYNNDGTWQYNYFDNNYIFTISSNVTQDYINQLNQQTATTTDEENQQNMEDAINNQTQSIDNINNTINDSNVDNSSVNLPTDNTQDITQSGVDNIFQTIFNSFTSGTAQDIVFPIPFTNKSIILQPNYVYNMLYNNNATWVITIIQAFWWYLISRFIISDIMNKIRKIKQGNFDNIQNSNIKEDML